jgi:hypothetical protein
LPAIERACGAWWTCASIVGCRRVIAASDVIQQACVDVVSRLNEYLSERRRRARHRRLDPLRPPADSLAEGSRQAEGSG